MKKLILSAVTLLVLASCNKNDNNAEIPYNGELRITSGISTRAVEDTWENGDEIGVTMFKSASTTAAIGKPNTPYNTTSTTTTADFTVLAPNEQLYFPQSDRVDIFAYYPYKEDVTTTAYAVDVTTQTDLSAIDLMTSDNITNIAKTKDALSLKFYHKLSKVEINLSPKDNGGLTEEDIATAKVKISNTIATATYNLHTDDITFSPEATVTDLEATAASSKATAIVIPQSTTPTFTITLANGEEYSVTSSSIVNFTSSKVHSFNISVTKTGLNIEGAIIAPWTPSKEDNLEANDLN